MRLSVGATERKKEKKKEKNTKKAHLPRAPEFLSLAQGCVSPDRSVAMHRTTWYH